MGLLRCWDCEQRLLPDRVVVHKRVHEHIPENVEASSSDETSLDQQAKLSRMTLKHYLAFLLCTFSPLVVSCYMFSHGAVHTYFADHLSRIPLSILSEYALAFWCLTLVLLGVASYCVWAQTTANESGLVSPIDRRYVVVTMSVHILQLCCVNFWLYLICSRAAMSDAVTCMVVGTAVWSFAVCQFITFSGASKTAGLLSFPYLMWICYEVVLSLLIAYEHCSHEMVNAMDAYSYDGHSWNHQHLA